MAIPAAISIAGIGLTAFGAIKGAHDKAEQADQEAAIKDAQAKQIEKNLGENLQTFDFNSAQYMGAAAVSRGKGNTGGDMWAIAQTRDQIARQRAQMIEEANFNAQQAEAGASMDQSYASNVMTSGYISAAGSLLSGASKMIPDTNDGAVTSLAGL